MLARGLGDCRGNLRNSRSVFLIVCVSKEEPNMAKEKFYMTTAIAYTSGKPHIGNTYEIVLADSIAQMCIRDRDISV